MGKKLKAVFALLVCLFTAIGITGAINGNEALAADGEFVFDPADIDATGVADKEAIPDGTSFVTSYFKSNGTMSYRTKNDAIFAIEIGKADTGSMSFTTGGNSDVTLSVASTGSTNVSAFALTDENGNVIANNEGVTTCSGTGKTIVSYTGLPAGTYYVKSPYHADYNRGVRLLGITVNDYSAGARAPRALWKDVAAPVITSLSTENGTITVNFDMVIGYDGADNVSIDMLSSKGKTVDTLTCAIDGDSGNLVFTPPATDTYSFRLYAIREGETKMMTMSDTIDFILPLESTNVLSATSAGNGTASIAYLETPEATAYDIYYRVTGDLEWIYGTTSTELTGTVKGLTVGTKYDFAIKSKRNDEIADFGETLSATMTSDARRAWAFSAFGTGVDTKNNYYTGSANEGDGSVRICSLNSKGKLQSSSTDGLAFYYTTINAATENFVLEGKIHVNSWKYTNGQDGFGLMACDAVAENGDGSVFWNNSYMITGTKVVYYFDTETGEIMPSSAGDTTKSVQMKLGLGAQEKIGVTKYLIDKGLVNTSNFATNIFQSTMSTLETSGKVYLKGNIIGNVSNPSDELGTYKELTDFTFRLTRNNTGYILTYIDEQGNESSKLYYDLNRENLTGIDEENIYVGFFASRTFDITVSDIKLTTSNPETDAPAEGREITYYKTQIKGISAQAVGSPDYTFIFYANSDGTLKLTNRATKEIIVENAAVKQGEYLKINTTLTKGVNGLIMEFTPTEGFKPNGEYSAFDDYSTKTETFEVDYEPLSGDIIYVSPDGSAYGKGTKKSPLSLQAALSYAHAGQTIYLAGGTYNMESKISVGRGQGGTEGNMIYVLPDPTATERPILDFGNYYAGIVIGGDYWYLAGFDVCNSGPSQKGLQISGNHCVVDNVNAYNNGNTGIQISRLNSLDTSEYWPTYNLILNCTSHDNADPGYEDADGFACKLTTGVGNVFDGCIAYCNADDGWDLYAKTETGSIGSVIIKNCIAYRNGYLSDGTVAGNGNGFKLGGSSISGYHELINCIAYDNKTKGIDSNSCPDVQVTNCTSFNNHSYNVAFYTKDAQNTDYSANGIISFRNDNGTVDNIDLKGTQVESKVYGETNYYWPNGNTKSVKASEDWFVSLDTSIAPTRNADGQIVMNGLLTLTDKAPADAGARLECASAVSIDFDDPARIEALKNFETQGSTSDSTDKQDSATTATPTVSAPVTTDDTPMPDPTASPSDVQDSESTGSSPAAIIILIAVLAAVIGGVFAYMRSKKIK